MVLVTNLDTAPSGGRYQASSIASFTRSGDVAAYGSGDVMSDDSASARALVFPGCGSSGRIYRARLFYGEIDTIDFELFLFEREPTNFADNGVLALGAADVAKMIGIYTFLDTDKKQVDTVLACYRAALDSEGSLETPYVSDGGNLYGLLVVRSIFTPAVSAKVTIRLQLGLDQ